MSLRDVIGLLARNARLVEKIESVSKPATRADGPVHRQRISDSLSSRAAIYPDFRQNAGNLAVGGW
jgi:hypothetical protein